MVESAMRIWHKVALFVVYSMVGFLGLWVADYQVDIIGLHISPTGSGCEL